MDDALTPVDLARELGIDQRTVRGWLREKYGTLAPPETRWKLTEAQAGHIRTRARGPRN